MLLLFKVLPIVIVDGNKNDSSITNPICVCFLGFKDLRETTDDKFFG